ncbi:ATP-binding cassette domain-containing protein [Aerococcus urinaeequi]
MDYILKTRDLRKKFNEDDVLLNINMHVKRGEIYGLLGPNGAGKSTLMKLLMNLLKPTEGMIELFDCILKNDTFEIFERMSAIIEYPVFYENLSAKDNLELHCEYMGYHNKGDIQVALDLVNLKNIDTKAVKNFSLGMKQRLAIARAIITKPELLILDEPINGLDPVGIIEIRDLIKTLNKEYGITILLSSHILAEIEHVADTIGVMNHGKLIEEVSMDSIREKSTEYIEIETKDLKKAVYCIDSELNISNFKVSGENKIRIYQTDIPQNDIYKVLLLNDVSIKSINTINSSLEEYFLNVIGGEKDA